MSELHLVPEPQPLPESPLSSVCEYIRRYVVLDDHALLACGLWVLHTYLIEDVYITPYMHIFSAEKESGKTTLRDTLQHLCARPYPMDYASAALLRRINNTWPPLTLLLDEVDALFGQQSETTESLRGVLNAGFRAGAVVAIMVPSKGGWQPEQFNVFGPKVLVGIGRLPDTIEGRCIPVRMKQKLKSETVELFRLRKVETETLPLRMEVELWANEARAAIAATPEPSMPVELSGRQQDCWSSLLAIADLLDVGEQARNAAVILHGWKDDESSGVRLLRDIKEIFLAPPMVALTSAVLTGRLNQLTDSEWGQSGIGGRVMSPSDLASRLRGYDIRPERLPRIYSVGQERGYLAEDFQDAWNRYL